MRGFPLKKHDEWALIDTPSISRSGILLYYSFKVCDNHYKVGYMYVVQSLVQLNPDRSGTSGISTSSAVTEISTKFKNVLTPPTPDNIDSRYMMPFNFLWRYRSRYHQYLWSPFDLQRFKLFIWVQKVIHTVLLFRLYDTNCCNKT